MMIGDYQKGCQQRVDGCLEALFVPPLPQLERLYQAMRYSVMNGGKRVRPLLVYAACEALNGDKASADGAACAVELIHAYSLVHDDLPCMDDDTLRRGRPTTHVQFDEATAMLAGDALQPLAFDLLASMPIAPALIVQATQSLARAAGSQGMAGGQAIDLFSVGRALSRDELQTMHSMKTGAMLACSVALGGIVAGASSATRQALDAYAQAVGLAFQVVDDILDVTSEAEVAAAAGADVVAVVTVVDRKTGAQAAVEAAGYRWRSVIDLDDLGLSPQ